MKLARTVFSVMAVLLLGLGYAASQFAAFTGTQTEYAVKADQPQIRYLALLLLLAAIGLAFVPDREGDSR